jgi:hypothetical protein
MEKRVQVNEAEVKKAFPGTGMVSDAKFKLLALAVAKEKAKLPRQLIGGHTVHRVKNTGLMNMNRDCEVVFQVKERNRELFNIWKSRNAGA